MTTLATRMRELSDLEGFDVVVKNLDGSQADLKQNGLPGYPHERKAKGTTTVAEWKARFEKIYPGYTCDLLNGDGTEAHGNTQVNSVRTSYEEP